jgi:hypothetical protein
MVQPAAKKSEAAAILLAKKTDTLPPGFLWFPLKINRIPNGWSIRSLLPASIHQKLKILKYTNSYSANQFMLKTSYQIRQTLQDLDFLKKIKKYLTGITQCVILRS